VRKLLFKLIRFSGLPFVFREVFQRNKLTILGFHDIEMDVAESVFDYLSKKYTIISLKDFVDALKNGYSYTLPSKSMVITFDDGHIGNYSLLPLIRRLGIPITVFLCAGVVGTNRHFWFKHEPINKYLIALKRLSNRNKLDFLSKENFRLTREYESPQALSTSQIEDMKIFVDFQSHTMFHPCLPQCDYDEAWAEIVTAKLLLEDKYKLNIYAFAYPNGDYTEREVNFCKQAGYQCAISVNGGFNSLSSDLFRLKRIGISDFDGIDEVVVKASGVWNIVIIRVFKYAIHIGRLCICYLTQLARLNLHK
jgi:peptidoglycan/xylan/chitin deacetylase (PgdA/CDA1 family)